MSCSNCYYYWNDEKYCPKRQMHMLAGDSCKYWKPNDARSISQRMNERSCINDCETIYNYTRL